MLALLVLDVDHQAGRQVRHAYRGVGGVHALPAGPGRPFDVDAQVLVRQSDLDLLRLRQDGNRGGGGVDATRGLGDRHALHAVHAALVLQA